ncbi:MAG: ABC transporter substrate-binding protein [Marmoricola sp.]
MRSIRLLGAAATTVGLLALSACGGSAGSANSSGSYGDCKVYGTKGSVKIHPVTPGVLTVQTNLPSPGWWKGSTPDSITGGYEYCLAANIAYRAGLDHVKVVNVSFDALVAGQTNNYDLAMAQISVTPARQKVVTFSAPYYDSNLGVLVPANSNVTADNIKSKRVAVQVSTTAVDFVNSKLKPSSVKMFPDATTMVTSVGSNLSDVAIQDTAIVLGFAKNSSGALKVVGQYPSGEHYAAIYPKGSTNTSAIDASINAMRADGTLNKLSAAWLGPELGGDPNAVPVWQVR